MAYIFGSIWDRYNRNALNDLSKSVEHQGLTIQELVAEGQLTPAQYAQLVSIVNGNVKKGSITTADIDKNNFAVDQTMITDSLRRIITGNAPINAVPANNSIDTAKLIDGSVTKAKRTVGGESAYAMPGSSSKNPNIDTTNKSITFYGITFFYHSKGRVTMQADTTVEFPESGSIVVAININSGDITARSGAEMFTLSENEVVLMHIVFTTPSQNSVKTVASNFDVTVDGNPIEIELTTGSVTSEKLYDGAVTRDKRTTNGETAFLMPTFSSDLLNINTVEHRFEISATSFIYWRNRRHTIDEDIHLKWAAGGNQFLTFNTESRTFNSYSGGNYPWVDENDILIAHVVFTTSSQNVVKTASAITDFTVNGLDYYSQNTGETDEIDKSDIIKDKVFLHSPLSSYDFVDTPVMETVARDTPNYIKAKTHQDIYADYDDLMNRHTEIMTKRIAGVDAWGNNINRYDIKPPELIGSNSDNKLPKIFWVVSIHGSEKTAGWVAFKTLEYILDNYKTDKRLENFVYNNHLIILPTANPSGWDDNTRHNRNGVDLNRNQPTSWRLEDEESVVYGGPHALSENESVVINEIINNETNLKYVADFHNFFLPAEDNYFLWIPSRSKQIVNIAKSFMYSFSHEIVKEYPELPENTFFGYSVQNFVGGSIGAESINSGVYGSTFEICEVFKMGDNELNSSMVITAGVKGFLNWNILMWQTLRTIDNEME